MFVSLLLVSMALCAQTPEAEPARLRTALWPEFYTGAIESSTKLCVHVATPRLGAVSIAIGTVEYDLRLEPAASFTLLVDGKPLANATRPSHWQTGVLEAIGAGQHEFELQVGSPVRRAQLKLIERVSASGEHDSTALRGCGSTSLPAADKARITQPRPVKTVEPSYSPEALKACWQGNVMLRMVVDVDGLAKQIEVVRPLGLGLDEKAIEAARQWRFAPGEKIEPGKTEGQPVPVRVNIEMNFHLTDKRHCGR